MTGSERVRFCSHCSLEVNNLSALTRKQAMRLVGRSNGRICVRYVKSPVSSAPVFAGTKLYQLTRRAGVAAGVLSATLSLSTLAYAQGKPAPNKMQPETQIEEVLKNPEKDKNDSPSGSVSGTVFDSNGAAVPNAMVNLKAKNSAYSLTTTADGNGFFRFENLSPDDYRVSFGGYAWKKINTDIRVEPDKESVIDISLEPEPNEEVQIAGEISVIAYKTPLFTAVSHGELEEVRDLIAKGEKVNRTDENYSHITPLFLAVENGSAEIAETLLNFGARINARDDLRQTPLMRLDEDAGAELVRLLIKHGARVNLTDKDGNTALMFAARSVRAEVLRILITRTANLDAQNSAGRTALMEAADADNLENVRELLAAGADPHLKDADGETALDLTTDAAIRNLLESYGAHAADEP